MNAISEWLQRSMSNQGKLLLDEQELGSEFFDLSTGVAGECMQKFVNYGQRLAIVIADPDAYSERFRELAREHENHPAVRFFTSMTAGQAWLADSQDA